MEELDLEQRLYHFLEKITPRDQQAYEEAGKQWDSIAKPLGSLGQFEEIVKELAALKGSAKVGIKKPVLTVFCSDNGVVEEGVSQSGQEVTLSVMRALAKRESTVSFMAENFDCEVIPVDVGVAFRKEREAEGEFSSIDDILKKNAPDEYRILNRRIRNGTGNIAKDAAFTRKECIRAIIKGIELAGELNKSGFDLILTGEMGIGNTTTSAAVAAVLSGKDPSFFVGRGAGLPDDKLEKKLSVVKNAVSFHHPDPKDIIDVLAKLGGLDLAALCGVFLGGAIEKIPVVIDGYIASVAALCAVRMNPLCSKAMIASHLTLEKGGQIILEEIGKSAVIQADMHLGEGGGAIMLLPLLKMALSVYNSSHSFEKLGIEAYQRFEQ
ncbi:MAG: nicotinate-nucleotide--dimethylbenzimidazole phosphoribosyltransferase [Lachnospiraceae bacterium]|nr:nicotinate-nucleotide--dimethylbenzimidazole phosphoribosyltransferase [Lachnospiraceae bacterium]